LVYAARISAREEVAHAPRQRPARPIDPQEGTPGCRQPQQEVVPAIADRYACAKLGAANLQPPRLEVEMPVPPRAVGGGRRPFSSGRTPRSVPKSRSASVPPESTRGTFLQEGPSSEREACSLFSAPQRRALNSNICLTPLGILVSFAGNTSGLVRTGADDRFTRAAVALAFSARDPISLHRTRAAWRCGAIEAEPQQPSGRRCGRVPRPFGLVHRPEPGRAHDDICPTVPIITC
jgi:hypothetical protein